MPSDFIDFCLVPQNPLLSVISLAINNEDSFISTMYSLQKNWTQASYWGWVPFSQILIRVYPNGLQKILMKKN